MLVTGIIPRGYCKGVVRAINIAKKATKEVEKKPLYILGMIVHNQYIVNALLDLGAITIEDKNKTREELLDEIDERQKYMANRLDESIDCINQASDYFLNQSTVEKILKPIEEKCSSYITYHYMYPRYKEEGHCLGTKEVELCSCHGLKRYCDFYKEDQ